MNTIGQQRSAYALDSVLSSELRKDEGFANFTAGAPSMILQNGLGQSMAFWLQKSKKQKKYEDLLEIVREWLKIQKIIISTDKKDFIKALSGLSQSKYLYAQKETLALLEWVKRYANAGL